ncbi:MAG: hypothetical protein ACREXR_02630, partial [Gammaproteobacteria bacterium]
MQRKAAIVTIRNGRAFRGLGYLVNRRVVITSAAVLGLDAARHTDATTISRELFELDRPFAYGPDEDNTRRTAELAGWYPPTPKDIAILRIKGFSYTAAAPFVEPANCSPLQTQSVEIYAYQTGSAASSTLTKVSAVLVANVGNVQIQWENRDSLSDLGFNGALVWSEDTGSLIGMIATVNRTAQNSVATIIPAEHLTAAFFDRYPNYRLDTLERHQAFKEEIVRGLECFGEYKGNVERYFDSYLGTPKLPVSFGGRQDVLHELDLWLASDVPYRLLAAPAGRGKSSVAVHWVMSLLDSQPNLKVIFLPLSTRFSTSGSAVALTSLLGRLRMFFPNIAISPSRSVDEFKSCFVSALETLRQDQHNKFLLVIDGIDETATGWADEKLLPSDPPKNLHALLSARFTADFPDEDAWLRRLGWIRKDWQKQHVFMPLPMLTKEGLGDVLENSELLSADLQTDETFLEELLRLSNGGEPLLVSLYIQSLYGDRDRIGSAATSTLHSLAPGYQGFMDHWLSVQQASWQAQHQESLPTAQLEAIFGLLAMAIYPLERDDIASLMTALGCGDRKEITDLLPVVARLAIHNKTNDSYTFAHPKLTEYFLNQRVIGNRLKEDYEQVIVKWCQRNVRDLNRGILTLAQCPEYVLHSYVTHLERSSNPAGPLLGVLTEQWLKAWFVSDGSFSGFLNDVDRVLRVLRAQRDPTLIGEELRCLLFSATVLSFTNNLNPEAIINFFLAHGCWTLDQALSFAYQYTDEKKRHFVQSIANRPLVREDTLEVLRFVGRIQDETARVESLEHRMRHVSEDEQLLHQAL